MSDGSSINVRERSLTWSHEQGTPCLFFMGDKREPFGQVLIGAYQVRTVEIATSRPGTSDSYTDRTIATLVGGGATFKPNPYVGFRVGADLQFYPETLPNARVTLGVVVPIGRRR